MFERPIITNYSEAEPPPLTLESPDPRQTSGVSHRSGPEVLEAANLLLRRHEIDVGEGKREADEQQENGFRDHFVT